MLDGTDHVRARRWHGTGHALAVARTEQLCRTKSVDSTPDTDIQPDDERFPHQLPHSGPDQVGHAGADRYADAHRHIDARSGQAGCGQYGCRGWYAVDGRFRQSDILGEWSGHQR